MSRRLVAYVALAVLVVANAFLISRLLARPAPAEWERPSAVETSTRVDGESASPQPPSEPPPASASPSVRLLAAASPTEAWRASSADCGEPVVLEHSVDAGRTWQPAPVEIAPVTRLRLLDDGTVVAIGGGPDCVPTYRSTTTDGELWVSEDQFLEGSWYVIPANRQSLATPLGEVLVPCAGSATDLAALDAERAAVLCVDGTVHVTNDAGVTWTAASLSGTAAAISADTARFMVAGNAPACDGVSITYLDPVSATVGGASGCAAAPMESGRIAVSSTSGAAWLWVGDEVLTSTDGGLTWLAPPDEPV